MSRSYLVPLVLPADPTAALEAATKQYVDAKIVGVPDASWPPSSPQPNVLYLHLAP